MSIVLLSWSRVRRVIISRKGFDSGYGKKPSPIFNDNRIFSLPIPWPEKTPTKYEDLHFNGISGAEALAEANVTSVKAEDYCHYDPYLNGKIGIFGQHKQAQGYLRNKEVGIGDLFLFFGLFKKYSSKERMLHHLFGWLQISQIIETDDINKFLSSQKIKHPHGYGDLIGSKQNTIYVSDQPLNIHNKKTNLRGHGIFKYSNNDLILTSPFHNTSTWQLPETYFQDFKSPEGSDGFFMRKFRTDKQKCLVDTSGQWQEAVLDVESNPKVIDWAIELITQYS